MTKILTLEEAREKAIYCYSYDNGDYSYQTENGVMHEVKLNEV